jgi:hypothetical protein
MVRREGSKGSEETGHNSGPDCNEVRPKTLEITIAKDSNSASGWQYLFAPFAAFCSAIYSAENA